MINTTTTSNGRVVPQFTSSGIPYDTVTALFSRMVKLANENIAYGVSDGRVTEHRLILVDLESFATSLGALNARAAVTLMLANVNLISSFVGSINLSIQEEMEIAVENTNQKIRNNS